MRALPPFSTSNESQRMPSTRIVLCWTMGWPLKDSHDVCVIFIGHSLDSVVSSRRVYSPEMSPAVDLRASGRRTKGEARAGTRRKTKKSRERMAGTV